MEDAMRIVSLNCWVGRVLEPLLAYLPAVDADVYCLQEVTWAPQGTPPMLRFVYKYKEENRQHFTNLYERFCELLPDHHGVYYPVAEFEVFDKEGKGYPIRFGIATFVRKKFAQLNSCSRFTYKQYWPGALEDPPVPCRAHAFQLWWPEEKRPILVAQMHGLWDPQGKGDTSERTQHLLNFVDIVNEAMRNEIMPSVVCGDLNILPSNQFLSFMRELGYEELVTGHGFTNTRTSFYDKGKERYADYMFVKGAQIKNFKVVYSPEVSDHCPLVLDIE
jgi:endonuclease/exonuclease/phosphatase family metal-dependent hydrolase